jgi:hypothetical protein
VGLSAALDWRCLIVMGGRMSSRKSEGLIEDAMLGRSRNGSLRVRGAQALATVGAKSRHYTTENLCYFCAES